MASAPTSRVLHLAGVATDVLTLAAQSTSKKHFVIIPGNPGIAQFYQRFAHDLHSSLRGAYHVHCVSYAGHQLDSRDQCADARVHGLHEQVPHKLALLDALAAESSGAQFVLFGHSIGAWVVLQMMRARPDLDIRHSFCGFPFLRFDLSWHQELAFRLLFLVAPLLAILFRVFSWFSSAIRNRIVRACGAPSDAISLANRLIDHPVVMQNAFFMGRDEFNSMPRAQFAVPDVQLKNQENLTYFWVRGDRWAPEHQLADLCKLLRGSEVQSSEIPPNIELLEHDPPVSHAFCVEHHSCALVAMRCGAVLQRRGLL